MANNWWDKFLDLFSEEVIEEEEIIDPDEGSRQRYEGYKQPIENGTFRSQKRLGRIEEGHRPARPRMINHYPQTQSVRVPIIDDRKGEVRRPSHRRRAQDVEAVRESGSHNERRESRRRSVGKSGQNADRQRREKRPDGERKSRRERGEAPKESEARPIREKFAGVNFRASDIPSPVYGFRQRPDLKRNQYESQEWSSEELVARSETQVEETGGSQERHLFKDERTKSPREIQEEHPNVAETQVEETGGSQERYLFKDERTESPREIQEEHPNVAETQESYASPLEDLYFYGRSDDNRDFPMEEQDLQVSGQASDISEIEQGGETSKTENSGRSGTMPLNESPEREHRPNRVQAETDQRYNTPYIPQAQEKQPEPKYEPYNVMMLGSDKVEKQHHRSRGGYFLPPLDLLSLPTQQPDEDEDWIVEQRDRLSETLRHFNVKANVVGVTRGPAVTRFEVQPAPGVKVSKIKKLNDDLKLNLAAKDIRIEAPIPGKSSVGIEIPNRTSQPVYLRGMIESEAFQNSESTLTAALGLDISGTPIVTDLQKMPHGLIGGATGSGKSVCINSLLVSLLYKATPDDVKLILIDPKVVELAPFKDIPHLAAPVINDPKEAALALKWAVEEMERRYGQFADAGARDIARYNKRADEGKHMPYIVIVIDELADLMMAAPHDVEESICRIAQKARACGIHLVLATQRPSVDVITGLIKANIPARLAFSVSSQADSRTILDMGGAEKLLGHGDMLFVENGAPQSIRVQGNFVSDDEIDRITDFVKQQGKPDYLFEKEQLQPAPAEMEDEDELFEDACFFVFEQGSASASALQRKFRIGYNRAARLIDMMEARGMISATMGSRPRDLLISEEEFLESMVNGEG